MNFRRFVVMAGLLAALTACGQGVPEQMDKIDKMLQTQIPMAPEDRARVESLRAEGERLFKEGKGDDAIKALKEAKKMLEKAADANLLNKSDG